MNITYCENIIIRGLLIFVAFMVHLNHENYNPTKYKFSFDFFASSVWNHDHGDHVQATGKRYITCGCESSAPFFVIYKAGLVLVIGLYELLGNPTT